MRLPVDGRPACGFRASVIRRLTLVSACLAAGLVAWSAVTHWLAWRFGMGIWPVPDGTPWTYQFLSGFLPSLAVIPIFVVPVAWYYHHTCHEKPGCLRWGKYEVAGGLGKKCHRHHPDLKDHPREHHGAVLDRLHEEWKERTR